MSACCGKAWLLPCISISEWAGHPVCRVDHLGLRSRHPERDDLAEPSQCQLRNEQLLAGYKMTPQLIDSVLDLARRNRPVCIYGFTSMLEYVARGVVGPKCALPPGYVRAAWNGGEMLFQEQSELFRKAFGVPILNRYGGRELSAMACQLKDGGPLHIFTAVAIRRGGERSRAAGQPRRTGTVADDEHDKPRHAVFTI